MPPFRRLLPVSVVALAAAFLVAVKWNTLALPCFWDEGYPYVHAIRYLADHKLTPMPSGMPALLSTGHPTLFYFLAAAWMRVFGTGMFAAHAFPLLVSVITLFALFRFGKTFFNAETGMFAVLLLVTRALFVAQSSQLLPETLLTLFTILSLHAWLQNNKGMYVLWASLLVLTKESGFVLPAALCLWELLSVLRYRHIPLKGFIKNRFYTALPFVTALLFFVVQRIQLGWFFFPRHIGFITFDSNVILNKLWNCMAAQLFIFMGGIACSVLVILSTLIFFVRKMKLPPVQRRSVGVILLFMILFVIFSCLNFYSPRYILCLYPLWFMLTAFIFLEALKGIPAFVPLAVLSCVVAFQGWYTFNVKTIHDSDLGYTDGVISQNKAIHWCLEHGYQHKEIFAQHEIRRATESDAEGFIKPGEEFTQCSNSISPQTSLFIFTSTDTQEAQAEARKLPLHTLAKFQSGKFVTEICSRDSISN